MATNVKCNAQENLECVSSHTKGNHTVPYLHVHVHVHHMYSPEQSLGVSDDESDPISMAEVSQPPLLLEARLSQYDNLVLLHNIFGEAAGKNLNSNVAVEFSQARVTHFSTVLTNVRFGEEELRERGVGKERERGREGGNEYSCGVEAHCYVIQIRLQVS